MSSDQFTVEEPKKSVAVAPDGLSAVLLFASFCGDRLRCGLLHLRQRRWLGRRLRRDDAERCHRSIGTSEEQKVAMKEQVSRLSQGVRDGEISMEQLGQIANKLEDSPVLTAIPVEVVRSTYLAKSGLTEEQKAEATRNCNALLMGCSRRRSPKMS